MLSRNFPYKTGGHARSQRCRFDRTTHELNIDDLKRFAAWANPGGNLFGGHGLQSDEHDCCDIRIAGKSGQRVIGDFEVAAQLSAHEKRCHRQRALHRIGNRAGNRIAVVHDGNHADMVSNAHLAVRPLISEKIHIQTPI